MSQTSASSDGQRRAYNRFAKRKSRQLQREKAARSLSIESARDLISDFQVCTDQQTHPWNASSDDTEPFDSINLFLAEHGFSNPASDCGSNALPCQLPSTNAACDTRTSSRPYPSTAIESYGSARAHPQVASSLTPANGPRQSLDPGKLRQRKILPLQIVPADPVEFNNDVDMKLSRQEDSNDAFMSFVMKDSVPITTFPLHIAILKGHVGTARTLLSNGAQPDCLDESGLTALHYAARGGHPEMVQLMLEYGVQPDIRDSHGRTAMFYAAESAHDAVITMLISYNATT